jgi:hypothetical protein
MNIRMITGLQVNQTNLAVRSTTFPLARDNLPMSSSVLAGGASAGSSVAAASGGPPVPYAVQTCVSPHATSLYEFMHSLQDPTGSSSTCGTQPHVLCGEVTQATCPAVTKGTDQLMTLWLRDASLAHEETCRVHIFRGAFSENMVAQVGDIVYCLNASTSRRGDSCGHHSAPVATISSYSSSYSIWRRNPPETNTCMRVITTGAAAAGAAVSARDASSLASRTPPKWMQWIRTCYSSGTRMQGTAARPLGGCNSLPISQLEQRTVDRTAGWMEQRRSQSDTKKVAPTRQPHSISTAARSSIPASVVSSRDPDSNSSPWATIEKHPLPLGISSL